MLQNNNSYVRKISYIAIVSFITLFLIIFSVKNQVTVNHVRMAIGSFYSPILKTNETKFYYANGSEYEEIKILTNQFNSIILKNIQEVAKTCKQIGSTYEELKQNRSRIIYIKPHYYSSNGFINDIIFAINNQNKDFIKINQPILSKKGLFGRISDIKGNLINILSIFNEDSRIPAYTESSVIYGIVAGNGTDIEFIHPNNKINSTIEGEIVFTSGENNLFMPNIPIGRVHKQKDKIIIKVFTRKRPPILGIIIKN